VSFTVGANGRVTRCAVTRSSGVAELDALTCRLIEERFRYRPTTDRFGRPVPDEVEGEHEWSAGRN
jgi:protein TonB